MSAVSFKNQLLGEVASFLRDVGMSCTQTQDGLVDLVVSISRYREEGVPLFPRVIICDQLTVTLRALGAGEHHAIGEGTRVSTTFRQALKKCAPLAREKWGIYIHRTENAFSYGVFREQTSPMAIDIRDALADYSGSGVILVQALTEGAVELIGVGGNDLVVHLSAVEDRGPSPREKIVEFADAAINACTTQEKEQLSSYFRTAISGALQRGHGALIVVVPGTNCPSELAADGVTFDTPISLQLACSRHGVENSADSLATLLAYASLLEGMLSCDGIVALGENGSIIGYNYFVKVQSEAEALPSTLVGGARRRAYQTLCNLVDEQKLYAAFFRSSDGGSELHIRVS